MKTLMVVCIAFFSTMAHSKTLDMYVIGEGLNVRLAPTPSAKITNVLPRGKKVKVFEIRFGWARVSPFYSGGLEGVDGEVARWVSYQYLSTIKPKTVKFGKHSTRLLAALSSSDDFRQYKSIFIEKSKELIHLGRCKVEDFEETGGWVRSVNYKPQRIYFTYCESLNHVSGRVYLDVTRKTLFQ